MMGVTVEGDKLLDEYFRQLPNRLQRGPLRKGLRAAGSVLIRRIRANIETMVSDQAASRAGKLRVVRRYNSRARKNKVTIGKTSLKRSIIQKPWTKRSAGILATVVGARWPEGAHSHLVEYGHRIVTHSGKDTGRRTRPIPFQRRAERDSLGQIQSEQRKALAKAIAKEKRIRSLSRV